MSTDQLHTALRDLVADADHAASPPVADELWAQGRRRRRSRRILPVAAVACVAALVTGLGWPSSQPREFVPSVQLDDGTVRLTAYPAVISKSPFIQETTTPGVTAALVPGSGDLSSVYAVSPSGTVTRVALPQDESELATDPSISPDGLWLARGPVLVDLTTGASIPSPTEQQRLARTWTRPEQPSWWSPDSRRMFVGAFNQGLPSSGGLVVGIDGSTTSAPLVEDGLVPIFAGWLDDDTLLVLVDLGAGSSRLEVRTWVVGEPFWRATGAVVSWSEEGESEQLRAQLSPDRNRLLVTRAGTDVETGGLTGTTGMMFDPRTGAASGMPLADGKVDPAYWSPGGSGGWDGWGCRSAWVDGLPVITDGGVVRRFAAHGDDLVSVSSGYGNRCIAFAGDELRGTPMTDDSALWQERLWSWGAPVLGLGLVALAIWWWARRHRGSWRERSRWLPSIVTQPF